MTELKIFVYLHTVLVSNLCTSTNYYFSLIKGIPYFYQGNLYEPEEVLEWIIFLQWNSFINDIFEDFLTFFVL